LAPAFAGTPGSEFPLREGEGFGTLAARLRTGQNETGPWWFNRGPFRLECSR